MNHKKPEQVTKAERSKAKAVTFGIIYGSGAAGLAGTMGVEIEEAQGYIDQWEARYEKAFHYRYEKLQEAEETKYITLPSGRSIYMGKRPDLPKCANYGVQGSAADAIHVALARLYENLHGSDQICALVHDEIVVECDEDRAEKVLELVEEAMVEGWLWVFPGTDTANLIESAICNRWSEKP